MNFIEIAKTYRRAGLCVLPAHVREKRPALSGWKAYQARLPTEEEIARWFGDAGGICLICGAVSGNLEMLDFDLAGEAFEPWRNAIQSANPALLDRLVVEQSPSKGWHVVYRCQTPVSGSLKLAQRKQPVDGPEEVAFFGKHYKPRRDANGAWHVILTRIETRGEGGLFLCAPSPGYELAQGDLTDLPVIMESERELLLQTAWELNQYMPEVAPPPTASLPSTADGRPGDDYNSHGDVREILRRHGWPHGGPGGADQPNNLHRFASVCTLALGCSARVRVGKIKTAATVLPSWQGRCTSLHRFATTICHHGRQIYTHILMYRYMARNWVN